MPKQYKDPVNYTLTDKDLANVDYVRFLNDLTDVPSSVALKPFSIDRAGIKEQYAYIHVRSVDDKETFVPVLANITMQVELKGHRGIHMSRCEEALFSLVEEKHESLDSFAVKLAERILHLQESDRAYVTIEGSYVHKRMTKKSMKWSYDRMTMLANAIAVSGRKTYIEIGLAAFNMTGCPCTETFTKFAVVPQLKDAGFDLKQIKEILDITNSGTHTQRGLATIKVEKSHASITYEKLYKILDDSCHLTYELLKRPDEHELVVRVLRNPQFTEDVVRDIVDKAVKILGKNFDDSSKIFASSQLFDSIHIHDVYTEIDKTYGELVAENE